MGYCLYFFSLYSEDSIDKELGFYWRFSKMQLLQDNCFCLIVFIKGNRVVRHVLYPRGKGDISTFEKHSYPSKLAVFKVEVRKEKGVDWYLLHYKQ